MTFSVSLFSLWRSNLSIVIQSRCGNRPFWVDHHTDCSFSLKWKKQCSSDLIPVRPDTSNPRIRFWFHFSVENVRKKQRIIFNVVNLSKTRNLFQQGMAPVVRSTNRPKWWVHVFFVHEKKTSLAKCGVKGLTSKVCICNWWVEFEASFLKKSCGLGSGILALWLHDKTILIAPDGLLPTKANLGDGEQNLRFAEQEAGLLECS